MIINKFVKKEDSLKKRYFIKLIKSITDAIINASLLLFVPRVLGPASYGSFSFIRDTLLNIVNFSDLNLNAAHINYASRKKNSSSASNVYFTFTLIVGLFLSLFLLFAIITGYSESIFPDQTIPNLIYGGLLAYLMYLSTALMGLSDSKIATYGFELRSIIINLLMFIVLLIIFYSEILDITTFFIQRIILYSFLILIGYVYLKEEIGLNLKIVNLRSKELRTTINTFLEFSNPLITLSFIGIFFAIFDRWFLQLIYGSISQGFFSLAFTLTSVASLFLAPMTPLLMQSIAKLDEENDKQGVVNSFDKVKFLYLIGAILSIFFLFHTEEILLLIGGDNYVGAKYTMMVMFLYPIHVVYGQFCGGALIALKKTKLYRNISIISTILGFVLTYILLAPKNFLIPGLELDSFGLALKLVLIQLISVMIQLFYVCKIFEIKILPYLISQIVIPIPIIIIGIVEWLIIKNFNIESSNIWETIFSLSLSFSLWGGYILILLWYFPSIFGLKRESLKVVLMDLLSLIKKKIS